MDSLARDVFLARQAGMSYGKWKATQPVKPIVPVGVKPKTRKCIRCGEMFVDEHNRGRKYCTDECRNLAWQNNHRRMRREELAVSK